MDFFVEEFKTKNNILILLVALIKKGSKGKCYKEYQNKLRQIEFVETTDEYFVDYNLMKAVVSASAKEVIAVGASVFINGVKDRSGGIIGNPFVEATSATGEVEEICTGIYCVAFPGRIGFVLKGSMELAKEIGEGVGNVIDFSNKEIVSYAILVLKEKTEFFILVSDGSGDGGYPYVCAYKEGCFLEKYL